MTDWVAEEALSVPSGISWQPLGTDEQACHRDLCLAETVGSPGVLRVGEARVSSDGGTQSGDDTRHSPEKATDSASLWVGEGDVWRCFLKGACLLC